LEKAKKNRIPARGDSKSARGQWFHPRKEIRMKKGIRGGGKTLKGGYLFGCKRENTTDY